MAVGDSASGLADCGGCPSIQKGEPEGVLQLSARHSTMSLVASFCGGCLGEWGQRPSANGCMVLYDWTRSLVHITNSNSDLFLVHVGLWPGCPLTPVLFITFMDRICRHSHRPERVSFGSHWISSLLFADDVALLAPLSQDLQHVLGLFAAECEEAGMRISTSKSKAMVLDRKKVACSLRVGGELLPQVEECKYLGVLFTSEGKMVVSVCHGEERAELKGESVPCMSLDLPVNLRSYPHLSYSFGHDPNFMTERIRSWIQAAKMSFLCRVAECSLRDRVRSFVTQEEPSVEPPLLHIERSQQRWLLYRMPPGHLPREVFLACPAGRRRQGRPRTR